MQLSLRRSFIPAAALTMTVGALGVAAINGQSNTFKPATTFDPAQTDICTSTTLCDNTQLKLGMAKDGQVSIDSPIGQSLKTIAARHETGLTDSKIVEAMTRFDTVLTHAMPTISTAATNGLLLLKGPQNAGYKAEFGLHALVADKGNCAVYAINPDGSSYSVALPVQTGSHAAPVPVCGKEAAALGKRMMARFTPV